MVQENLHIEILAISDVDEQIINKQLNLSVFKIIILKTTDYYGWFNE